MSALKNSQQLLTFAPVERNKSRADQHYRVRGGAPAAVSGLQAVGRRKGDECGRIDGDVVCVGLVEEGRAALLIERAVWRHIPSYLKGRVMLTKPTASYLRQPMGLFFEWLSGGSELTYICLDCF